MPPQPVSSPTRRFVLTKIENSVETNVAVSALLPNGFTSDQTMRAAQLASVRGLKRQNPNLVYRLYSPSNSGNHTDGDCVWDSRVSD